MIRKKTLSIGIPAFNEEANIGFLIRSVIKQREINYKLKEIIVISDGSIDKTSEKIKEVKDKRIKFIEGKTRIGQNKRFNQIVNLMNKKSAALLLLEADTFLKDHFFIKKMVDQTPIKSKYSFISATATVHPSITIFGKIMDFGFNLRRQIFYQASDPNNLYLISGVKLISKEFLNKFQLENDFHEDSYIYRKAQNKKYPIFRSAKAKVYYKSAENLHDYLLQSSKFQKAMKKESKISNIYSPKLDYLIIINIVINNFIKNPFYFISYFGFAVLARIYSKFINDYTVFWKQYKSTKKFNYNLNQKFSRTL